MVLGEGWGGVSQTVLRVRGWSDGTQGGGQSDGTQGKGTIIVYSETSLICTSDIQFPPLLQ